MSEDTENLLPNQICALSFVFYPLTLFNSFSIGSNISD